VVDGLDSSTNQINFKSRLVLAVRVEVLVHQILATLLVQQEHLVKETLEETETAVVHQAEVAALVESEVMPITMLVVTVVLELLILELLTEVAAEDQQTKLAEHGLAVRHLRVVALEVA
jgi:hypothetical protein